LLTLSVKSTNDYRRINGSGARLLYFVDPAVTKVQMIYEVSMVSTLTSCTFAIPAPRLGVNTGVHLCKSAFVKATIATAAEAAHAQNYMKHWRIGFFF